MIDTNELRRLAQAANEHSDDRAEILAEFYAVTQSDTIIEILDRLEAAEKERDNVAQQLVQSEIGKRDISEAHNAVTRRLSTLADENEAMRAEVIHIKEVEFPRKAQAVADGWRGKCERLEAKIAEMERQEPVGVLHVGSYYGEELQDWEFEADQRVCDRLNERHVTNPTSLKLYTLPGALGE